MKQINYLLILSLLIICIFVFLSMVYLTEPSESHDIGPNANLPTSTLNAKKWILINPIGNQKLGGSFNCLNDYLPGYGSSCSSLEGTRIIEHFSCSISQE
jgi:hypothetical protein